MIKTTFDAVLPYPPASKSAWHSRIIESQDPTRPSIVTTNRTPIGFKYIDDVYRKSFMPSRIEGRLAIKILVQPPDKRQRGVDDVVKVVLDSIKNANIYSDDSQVDYLNVERLQIQHPGRVVVYFCEYEIREDLKPWIKTTHRPTRGMW